MKEVQKEANYFLIIISTTIRANMQLKEHNMPFLGNSNKTELSYDVKMLNIYINFIQVVTQILFILQAIYKLN